MKVKRLKLIIFEHFIFDVITEGPWYIQMVTIINFKGNFFSSFSFFLFTALSNYFPCYHDIDRLADLLIHKYFGTLGVH